MGVVGSKYSDQCLRRNESQNLDFTGFSLPMLYLAAVDELQVDGKNLISGIA